MKSQIKYFVVACGLLSALSACTDDKYDLSELDTTTAIRLDNLVVPVSLDEITIDQLLDIEDEDIIVKFINPDGVAKYAIKVNDSFYGDQIFINILDAISETTIPEITISGNLSSITNEFREFSYLINNVDPSLVAISYIGMTHDNPMKINLNINSSGLTISDMVLSIPDYFVANYKGQEITNGIIPVSIANDGSLDEPVYITAIEFSESLTPINNSIEIKDLIGISSAKVSGSGSMTLQFSMSPFSADIVSGRINYKVEDPEIDPVSLDDLPDFLKDGDSNLILLNPQIYFTFNNLAGSAPFSTNLMIAPEGYGRITIDTPVIPFTDSIILAAADSELDLKEDYSADTDVQVIPELKYIIAGDGLPSSINFKLYDTFLKGTINKLQLGQYLDVRGDYTFFAPLSFEKGSKLIYVDSETDFFDSDVSYIDIDYLSIKADASTTFPFAVTLTAIPLDNNGDFIEGVRAEVLLNEYAVNQPINLEFNKPFKGLNGIYYEARFNFENEDESLLPSQTITLKNLKATISGKYLSVEDKYQEDYK